MRNAKISFFILALVTMNSCGSDNEELPPAPERVQFEWDMSNPTEITYYLQQTTTQGGGMGKQEVDASGKIDLIIDGEGLVDLVVRDMKAEATFPGRPEKKMNQTMPDQKIEDIDINQVPKGGDGPLNLASTLALPARGLELGEEFTETITFTFSANRKEYTAIGVTEYKYDRNEMVKGHPCAVLTAKTTINHMTMNTDTTNQPGLTLSGSNSYYFDYVEEQFIGSSVRYDLSIEFTLRNGDKESMKTHGTSTVFLEE